MGLETNRLNYLRKKFGVQSLELADNDATERANQRQKYLDDEEKRRDENIRRMGEQVQRGANKFNVFRYMDTASIRGHEKLMHVEVFFHKRF